MTLPLPVPLAFLLAAVFDGAFISSKVARESRSLIRLFIDNKSARGMDVHLHLFLKNISCCVTVPPIGEIDTLYYALMLSHSSLVANFVHKRPLFLANNGTFLARMNGLRCRKKSARFQDFYLQRPAA